MSYRDLQLSDGSITIRPIQSKYLDAVYEAIRESLPELGRALTWAHPEYQKSETEEFLRTAEKHWGDDREFSWLTFDAGSGQLLGGCGLNYVDPLFRRCNLGYWVRTSWAGKGITTAATRLLARWALFEKGFERVEIVIETHNQASRKVALKAGAQFEGIARKRLRLHDAQLDAAVFSLVRADFEETAQ